MQLNGIRPSRCGARQWIALSVCGLLLGGVLLAPKRSRSQGVTSSNGGYGRLDDSGKYDPVILPGFVEAVRQAAVALFEKQCDIVFTEVDHDGNGRLNSAELHVAVLLVYSRLNEILGGTALSLPGAEEIRLMFFAADDGDGKLTREEFKEFFTDTFARRIAALLGAHLLTEKIIVPATAMGFNILAEHLQMLKRLDNMLTSTKLEGTGKDIVKRKLKQVVTNKAVRKLVPAVGPILNVAAAGAVMNRLKVEMHLARALDTSDVDPLRT